jgi:cell fate regulator YaaT (PSP1 superfamily)
MAQSDEHRRIRTTRPRNPGSAARLDDACRGSFRTATDGGAPIGEPRVPTTEHLIAAEDLVSETRRHLREQDAHRIALLKIRERSLPMKLTRVEVGSDSRLVFYFTAEGRVDFRELVKELASELRARIEMRQIGVRDEARMLGGYGSCGRPLCCAVWLSTFEPVSIKMAKVQDLTLNPTKLSGLCGRLKCCLRFELADDKIFRRGHGKTHQPSNGDDKVPDEPPTGAR